MSSRSELEAALVRVLHTLRDYRDDLVLVGGWIPYLHLRYGRAAVPVPRTSLTSEADLLIPTRLKRGDRRPIAKILREAGFEPRGATGIVWARKPEQGGETIEFLQPLEGPARNRGEPSGLADQPDLKVLTLDHLRVMQDFTETLLIPASASEGAVEVRVPTIGAFVLNKANTFHIRGGRDAGMKAGKDLLYLRDLMAAGERVAELLESDLDAIAEAGGEASTSLERAAYHLRRVAQRYYGAAASILAERDGLDVAAARGDVEGYVTDAVEIVTSRAARRGPLPQE